MEEFALKKKKSKTIIQQFSSGMENEVFVKDGEKKLELF